MTKLQTLRSRLVLLRNLRVSVRWLSAAAAVAATVIVLLMAIFIVDYLCELYIAQRLVLLAAGAIAAGAAFWFLAWPLLAVRETTTDMALLVERNNQINSDLIAALQFESPQASRWGSLQLSGAVVDYMVEVSPGLHVFDGLPIRQLAGRALALAAALAVAIGFVVWRPDHASAFWQRMLLGDAHYPTATQIDRVQINGRVLLQAKDSSHQPQTMVSPQGRALQFGVVCSGQVQRGDAPVPGEIRFKTLSGGQSAKVELQPQTTEERIARLTSARALLSQAIADDNLPAAASNEVQALLAYDAEEIYQSLAAAENIAAVQQSTNQLDELIANPPESWQATALYTAQWDRFTAPIAYQIFVGDAWTEWAEISMIPLPVVDLMMEPIAPSYAQEAEGRRTTAPHVRQIAVLEGSRVNLSIIVANEKPLREASLFAKTPEGEVRFDLQSDAEGSIWKLPADNPLLSNIRNEVRFQIDVTDRDGLHLERPIEGSIRLRADRTPSGSLTMVNQNRVLLPGAKPLIGYTASDDYGLSKIALEVQIDRARTAPSVVTPEGEQPDEPTEADAADLPEQKTLVLSDGLIPARELPQAKEFRLETSSWNLSPGDSLKLSLKVVDYRGSRPGKSYSGEPILLQITDLSGVNAGLTELDEAFEKRSNELLEIELGIGESP